MRRYLFILGLSTIFLAALFTPTEKFKNSRDKLDKRCKAMESITKSSSSRIDLPAMEIAPCPRQHWEKIALGVKNFGACTIHDLAFENGWYSFWGTQGHKLWCKRRRGMRKLPGQFSIRYEASLEIIGRCGPAVQVYDSQICPSELDGEASVVALP